MFGGGGGGLGPPPGLYGSYGPAEENDDPVGCSCSDGCLNSMCSCVSLGYSSGDNCNHYSSNGHISSWNKFIVECDSSCSCDSTCLNRVVQRGAALDLCVSQTDPTSSQLSNSRDSPTRCGGGDVDKGLGLYTLHSRADRCWKFRD